MYNKIGVREKLDASMKRKMLYFEIIGGNKAN